MTRHNEVKCLVFKRNDVQRQLIISGMILVFWPSLALADMVWPALFLERRILSIWPITTGLFIEWLVLRFGGFGLSWKRAALVDITMNAASTVMGIVLIPLAGIIWEIFPGIPLYKIFGIGTFNPGTWIGTYCLAVLITTGIEALVVLWGFRIIITRRRLGMLCLANALSVGIAFVSVLIRPPQS